MIQKCILIYQNKLYSHGIHALRKFPQVFSYLKCSLLLSSSMTKLTAQGDQLCWNLLRPRKTSAERQADLHSTASNMAASHRWRWGCEFESLHFYVRSQRSCEKKEMVMKIELISEFNRLREKVEVLQERTSVPKKINCNNIGIIKPQL